MILTSVDGINWQNVSLDNNLNYYFGAAYGESKFLIVGNKGEVLSSINGFSWNLESDLNKKYNFLGETQ